MNSLNRRLEVRSGSGRLLFSIDFRETDAPPGDKSTPESSPKPGDAQTASVVKPTNGQTSPSTNHNATSPPTGAVQQSPSNGATQSSQQTTKSNGRSDEAPMTDAQKRLLFRLLVNRGIEGDKAHEHLKKLFEVSSLKEVSKLEASRGIEKLLDEAKGASHVPA